MKIISYIKLNSRRIFGFFILIVGALLAFLLIKDMVRDLPVWVFGQKTLATIEDKWYENFIMEEAAKKDFNPIYLFKYKFITPDGREFFGESQVPDNEWLSYAPGGEIMVKYSRWNPNNNRLDDSRLMPFLLCSYIPFILICWFAFAAGRELVDE